MTYSIDFRRKVLKVRELEGLSVRETSKRFQIGSSTVIRWVKRIEAFQGVSRRRKLDKAALLKDVQQYPEAYQHERATRFHVSQSAIGCALRKLGMSYKKTLRHPKANENARHAFQETIRAYLRTNRAVIYLDESGFAHDMPRTHGYSFKGQRCWGIKDWQAKGRTKVIGALMGTVLLTVSLFQSHSDRDTFHAWAVHDLLPKLPPASVIVLDNASFHKRIDTQNAFIQAGHILEY